MDHECGGERGGRQAECGWLSAHESSLYPLLFPLVKVRRTKILVRLLLSQQRIDDCYHAISHCNQGPFLTPTYCNAPVLGYEIGIFRFRRDVRNFDQHLP